MAVTDDQIRQWIQNNPGATEDRIAEAMAINGVPASQVARVLGSSILPNAPAAVQVAQYQEYVSRDPRFNDINRAAAAQLYGVDAQELASAGVPADQVSRIMAAQSQIQAVPGQITDDQIRAWVSSNPAATTADIMAKMQQFGVSESQLGRALGATQNAAVQQARSESIPTGQLGFEEATRQGVSDVTNTLRAAQAEARGALDPAMEEVARLYNLNVEGLRGAETAARSDLASAQNLQRGIYGQNVEGLQGAGAQARGDIERTYGAAGQMFQPYQQAGITALQQEQALSGALGQEAFNQAYQESPYIRFLREQGERSTLSGAAATGGLGGGRVQQELVRFGQGLAGQGLQQQIQNLRALSGQGLQAAGSGATIQTGMGTNLANLGVGTAESVAAQRAALAGTEGQYGTNLANLSTGTAQNMAAQRAALAGERSQYGTNLANLAVSTGTNIANTQGTGAQNIANQRAATGQLLGGQLSNATAGLSNLAINQGASLANILSQFGNQGLNLQQAYTADQISALENAAQQEAAAQQGYGGQIAAQLGGQPYIPQQPANYGGMVNNAMQAAALGYDLAGNRQQSPQSSPYVGEMSRNYPVWNSPQQTTPMGQYAIPGVGTYNFLNSNFAASRLGGVR